MKKINLYVGSLILLILNTPVAWGFTLVRNFDGNATKGWKVEELAFDIDQSCNPYRTIVDEAMNAAVEFWNSVSSASLKISIGSTVTLPKPIGTYIGSGASEYPPVGNPIIYCDTVFGTNTSADPNRVPGYATSANYNAEGVMTGSLLVLNLQANAGANITTYSKESVQVVLAHEVGHVLGLGHSSDGNALMYYATSSGRKLVPSKDDIDGLTYLYPRQEPGMGGLMGCGTLVKIGKDRFQGPKSSGLNDLGDSQSGHSNGALSLSLFLLLFVFIWRFSRKVSLFA